MVAKQNGHHGSYHWVKGIKCVFNAGNTWFSIMKLPNITKWLNNYQPSASVIFHSESP